MRESFDERLAGASCAGAGIAGTAARTRAATIRVFMAPPDCETRSRSRRSAERARPVRTNRSVSSLGVPRGARRAFRPFALRRPRRETNRTRCGQGREALDRPLEGLLVRLRQRLLLVVGTAVVRPGHFLVGLELRQRPAVGVLGADRPLDGGLPGGVLLEARRKAVDLDRDGLGALARPDRPAAAGERLLHADAMIAVQAAARTAAPALMASSRTRGEGRLLPVLFRLGDAGAVHLRDL